MKRYEFYVAFDEHRVVLRKLNERMEQLSGYFRFAKSADRIELPEEATYLFSAEDGLPVIQMWHGARKLTIYVDLEAFEVLRVENDVATTSAKGEYPVVASGLKWLIEVPT